jgi:hypothetical protein
VNRCPGKGCTAQLGADQVACRGHWFSLPKPLRDRIWQLYRREQGSDAHREAVFEAVRILSGAE